MTGLLWLNVMRRKLSWLCFWAIFLLGTACGPHRENEERTTADTLTFRHASLLLVVRHQGYTVAEVLNPWHPSRLLHRYLLVPRSAEVPPRLPQGTLLRTPLRRMTVAVAAHGCLFREIGAEGAVRGVCDVEYILSPWFRKALQVGKVADMGSSTHCDVEKILAVHCDAVLLSPYDQCNYGAIEKTQVPIVECADYMETSPLGRAEWMRFYGMLVGREAVADSIFKNVEREYTLLKARAQATEERPSLFADLMTGSTWYQPGGRSTMGRLYADAGVRYLWDDNERAGSLALDYESVFHRAHDAALWVVRYGAPQDFTYASLLREQPGYARFRAHRQRHIWGCNLFRVPFFEDGAFHPERLLSDLVHIAHPHADEDAALHYFSPLHE